MVIEWKEGQATGIIILLHLVEEIADNNIEKQLHIRRLNDSSATDILGNYTRTDTAIIFRPLISFTRGLKYEVVLAKRSLGEIDIPVADANNAPAIVAIYPTADTLPENLLKFYIRFSKPMKEGDALNHILLLKNGHDTAQHVFLDLQPELWNNDRTMLTVWLDPGRIKRDLQPNKQMGPPLQPGLHYSLLVKDWQDTEGGILQQPGQKDFFTGPRDSISPAIEKWIFTWPAKETTNPLIIELGEPLDYTLLNNTIRIIDETGNLVPGKISIEKKETALQFIPKRDWKSGKYFLETESRLEDLAGNNLNRLFDTDLVAKQAEDQRSVHKLEFRIF